MLTFLSNGLRRASQAKGVLAAYWLVYLLLGLLLALPFSALLSTDLANSLYLREMGGHFDVAYISELLRGTRGAPAAAVGAAMPVLALMFFLVNVLLSAGAIRRLTGGRFGEGATKYFWRFVRLFLMSLLFLAVLAGLNGGLTAIADRIWGDGSELAPLAIAARIRVAVMFLLFGVVVTVFDIARVRIVVEDVRSVVRTSFWALRFVLRRVFWPGYGIWLLTALFSMALVAAYFAVAPSLPQTTGFGVLLLVVLQQMVILGRICSRITLWGSLAALYEDRVERPLPVPLEQELIAPPAAGPSPVEGEPEQLLLIPPLTPQTDEEAAGPA